MDKVNGEFGNMWENCGNYTNIVSRESIEESENPINSINSLDLLCDEYHLLLDSQDRILADLANDVMLPNEQSQTPVVPRQGAIPCHYDYVGIHNFHIGFDPDPEKITKSLTWTYSEKCSRLYVGLNKNYPVRFFCDNPPDSAVIRTTLIYVQPDYMGHLVSRCPRHVLPADASNTNADVPMEHVLRCTDLRAVYQSAEDSHRHSIAVPYVKPQVGNYFSTYYYSFACLTSCVGGMNRKPVKLIFTLEDKGEIIGRAVVDVKCSASPGRDRIADEKKVDKEVDKEVEGKRPKLKRLNSSDSSASTKKRRTEGTGQFVVSLDNEADYRLVLQVVAGLKALRESKIPSLSQLEPGPSGVESLVHRAADSSQQADSSDSDGSQQHLCMKMEPNDND